MQIVSQTKKTQAEAEQSYFDNIKLMGEYNLQTDAEILRLITSIGLDKIAERIEKSVTLKDFSKSNFDLKYKNYVTAKDEKYKEEILKDIASDYAVRLALTSKLDKKYKDFSTYKQILTGKIDTYQPYGLQRQKEYYKKFTGEVKLNGLAMQFYSGNYFYNSPAGSEYTKVWTMDRMFEYLETLTQTINLRINGQTIQI